MFKKLKQKIEEGGDVGLERSSFSPIRLPGSIVRANSDQLNSGSVHTEVSPEPEVLPEPELQVQQIFRALDRDKQQNGELPGHFGTQSHSSYQAVLEKRIRDLEGECSGLKDQLSQQSSQHLTKVSRLEKHISELDSLGTNLKMQIVEFELDKAAVHQEHEKEKRQLQELLSQQEESSLTNSTKWEVETRRLQAEIEEKERGIINEENKCRALEKKCQHFESQLKAYEAASENEVVSRLHCEVADVEQRVKSRNLEIEILERRIASQAKENQDQVEGMLNRQEELERINKDLMQVAKEEKIARKEMIKEVERIHQEYTEAIKLQEDLKKQLAVQEGVHHKLALEYKEFKVSHTLQTQEMEQLLEDKNRHIRELGHQLKRFSGEQTISEPLPRLPGIARRTASIAVQASEELEAETQVLDESNEIAESSSVVSSGDTLEAMKQRQCALDEELAEKLKVGKGINKEKHLNSLEQIIRVQQQRIMDLKKELRSQTATATEQGVCGSDKGSPAPLRVAIASDVNFQYLKHVVIKFMCSREDEALQLIRAVATLLEFSPQEEEHVKGYLNYKMSWFGVIPPPLFAPMQTIK